MTLASKEHTVAVILANGRLKQPKGFDGVSPYKALTKVCSEPMILYTIRALIAAGIKGIVIVCNWETEAPAIAEQCRVMGCHIVPGKEYITDNIEVGIHASGSANRILIATDDVPAMTGEDILSFILACEHNPGRDVYWAIGRQSECRKEYPGLHRTTVRLRGVGKVCGGNLTLIANPTKLFEQLGIVNELLSHRKELVKMAGVLGVGFLAKGACCKYLSLPLLRISAIEQRLLELTGIDGKAVWGTARSVTDIDREPEIAKFEKLVGYTGAKPQEVPMLPS